jgi:hypothetical protein
MITLKRRIVLQNTRRETRPLAAQSKPGVTAFFHRYMMIFIAACFAFAVAQREPDGP